MSKEHPDFICPSCMWQGDETDAFACPDCCMPMCLKCGEELLSMANYKQAQANNARDEELEERRIDYGD